MRQTHILAPARRHRPPTATPDDGAAPLILLPALLAGMTVGALDVAARLLSGTDLTGWAAAWLFYGP